MTSEMNVIGFKLPKEFMKMFTNKRGTQMLFLRGLAPRHPFLPLGELRSSNPCTWDPLQPRVCAPWTSRSLEARRQRMFFGRRCKNVCLKAMWASNIEAT